MDRTALASYYHLTHGHRFSQADFEALLGHPVPANVETHKGQYTLNTPLSEMNGSWLGRWLYKMLSGNMQKMIKGQEDTPTGALILAMVPEMPMRSMLMSGGPSNRRKLEALLLMINGHVFKGLLALIKPGAR